MEVQGELQRQHEARKARLARLRTPGYFILRHQETPQEVAPPQEVIRPQERIAPSEGLISDWVERQRQNYRPWFSVEADLTPPTIEDIQRAVCRYFKITKTDLLSECREPRVVYPRWIAVYLCRTLTTQSLPKIGRRFGDQDHTTVLNGIRRIKQRMQTDWECAYDVHHCEALI